MTSTEHLSPLAQTPGPPTRLSLLPPDTGAHRLDGTWWPRSHDLGRELPALIAALEERWPGITRVTVSRPMWRVRPETLLLGERVLHINRSEGIPHPHTICLLSYGVGRCDLLVIPPGAKHAEVYPQDGRSAPPTETLTPSSAGELR